MRTETEQIIYKTGTAFGQSENIGIYALASAVNELAAEGTCILSLRAQILLPPGAHKPHAYAIEKRIKKACKERQLPLDGVQFMVSSAVSQYMVTVTGISRAPKEEAWCRETMRAGQDIVLTKWIGLEGTLRIMEEKEAELKKHFAPVFLADIRKLESEIFAGKEIAALRGTSHLYEKDAAAAGSVSVIRQTGEGGIFAALWRLAKEADTGIAVDMKKMSVRQETIEVCEYFRLNPYQLASAGSLLMIADDGEVLADALTQEGIQASVIGSLTDNNDKIIRNGEDVRFLDRPAPDALMSIL